MPHVVALGVGHAGDHTEPLKASTAAEMATKLHKAAIDGRWQAMMKHFGQPRLLVVDLCRDRDYAEGGARTGGFA